VVTSRSRDNTTGALLIRQRHHFVVRASALEAKYRLKILSLQMDVTAETLRQ
jgi:hypothetical protein